jgi:hypothetical protein
LQLKSFLHKKETIMKNSLMQTVLWILGMSIIAFSGCAPVFSELQSARTVGKDKVDVTPLFSTVTVTEEGETEGVQNHIGLQLAYGLSPKVDIRVRYEYVWPKGDGEFSDGISVLGIGPKIGILEEKLAFSMPFGRAFGEATKDTWQLHPTLILSLPLLKDRIEFNLAPKYLMTFCKECDDFVAINFGLAFSNNLSKWAVRPEYGLLYNIGEEGHVGQFSIGLSTVLNWSEQKQ